MKKLFGRRVIATVLIAALACSVNVMTYADGNKVEATTEFPERVGDEGCKEIPNTESQFSEYNTSFLSVNGFAAGGVNDRSEYVGTDKHRQVKTAAELVEAIYDAQSGSVKVIEIMNDINAGYTEARVDSKYSDTSKETCVFLQDSMNSGVSVINPLLAQAGGVSKIQIKRTDGLTIFSRYGATLYRTEFDVQDSSNDIVFRNIRMDGSWQWDNHEAQLQKESGITYMKINGDNVWVDHCEFTIAPDGCIDMESDAHGVTYSWCKFGLDTDEAIYNETIYESVMYLEELYQMDLAAIEAGTQTEYVNVDVNGGTRYRKMREGGATPEEIMQYTAYHAKVHLGEAGDKDIETNQYLRLSLGYNHYESVGSRIPLIRQGIGHLYNCYIDNTKHGALHDKFTQTYGIDHMLLGYAMARCINTRNGSSIAADTCVFSGTNEPIIGTEYQGDDASYNQGSWEENFSNTYNRSLIVNSKCINSDGDEYVGSSWDNNGENQFCKGYKWHDKSTIKNWAWSSKILTEFTGTSYIGVFDIQYNYDEKLPYSYQLLPLDDVDEIVPKYSGMGVYDMTPKQWCQVEYTKDCGIEPAGDNKVYIASDIAFVDEAPEIYVGDVVKLETVTTPNNVTDAKYTWSVKNKMGSEPKAIIDETTGELTALKKGEVTVTVVCESVNGTTVTDRVTFKILDAASKPAETTAPAVEVTPKAVDTKHMEEGYLIEAGRTIRQLDYGRLKVIYKDKNGKVIKEVIGDKYKPVDLETVEGISKWEVKDVARTFGKMTIGEGDNAKEETVCCAVLEVQEYVPVVVTPTPSATGEGATPTPSATGEGATPTPSATGEGATPTPTAPVGCTTTSPAVEVTPTPSTPGNLLLGDANEDKKVNLQDASLVLKAALNIVTLEGQAVENADANQDEKVNLQDASLVLKAALNIVKLEPKK